MRSNLTASAEKAWVLTTLMWVSKDGYKRQRSPDSNFHTELNRRTAVRKEQDDHNATICSQTYAISITSLYISDRQSTLYESILELLRDFQDAIRGGRPFLSIRSKAPEWKRTTCDRTGRLRQTRVGLRHRRVKHKRRTNAGPAAGWACETA